MKIESQCCTLAQAKKLKVLGVMQESVFYWHERLKEWKVEHEPEYNRWAFENEQMMLKQDEHYSAFTVAELGVMLPGFPVVQWETYYHSDHQKWNMQLHGNALWSVVSEAKGRAEILITLLEVKGITVDEVNQRLQVA